MRPPKTQNGGFTLIEILVAIAILGTAVVVLLDAHYTTLRLFDEARQESMVAGFMESALGIAEMEVQAGNYEGSGDFGKGFQGFGYTFSAKKGGEDEEATNLYDLTVTITVPQQEARTVKMLVYRMEQDK